MELSKGRLFSCLTGWLLFLALTFPANKAACQETQFNYYYRIYFRDKGNQRATDIQPQSLLSDRAIARRLKAGIPLIDYRDLPVFRDYIFQINDMGLTFHCASKWMNTALFKTAAEADTSILKNLDFVTNVTIVKRPSGKSAYSDKLELSLSDSYPPYDNHLIMLNGYTLINSGFNGKGILVAVLDGGFDKADVISGLSPLRGRNGIKATKDLITGGDKVYNYSSHGTAVLTVLAGQITGQLEGVSQGADYLLIRTEDGSSEFPVEEDFWAAGAEYADSCGADIISSSLGYSTYDAPEMSYDYSDMDGNSTFVSRAADIAASKGILVVTSAGNARDKQWVRIIAPSDGDSVICAGAVDGNGIISTFSSAGPSADGRVKPDNVAQGVSVTVQVSEESLSRVNGTSFSCPILSGFSACLMQAFPDAVNTDIISSSDRLSHPDSLYGYGIPDLQVAAEILEGNLVFIPEKESVASPNPFTGDLEITFRRPPGMLRLDIYTVTGEMIISKQYNEYITRRLVINDLQNAPRGLYFIRMATSNGVYTNKVIKIDK